MLAKVRVLGGWLGWPHPSCRHPPLPLGRRPCGLGRGKGCTPPPLYKEGPQERRAQHNSMSPSSPGGYPPPPPSRRPPPPSSLSPTWHPEGLHRRRDFTTAACRRAVEFLDPCPMPSTSAILAGTGILGVNMIVVHVRVRGGVTHVTPKSLLQDLHRP
jgi:hypothetical protein